MKKVLIISFNDLFLIICSLLVFACNDKSLTNPSEGNNFLISVNGEDTTTLTKTTLSSSATLWIASSDKIGVYSPQASLTAGGVAGVINAQYTATTGGTNRSPFSGTMYWKSGTHNFYAYYPYSSGSSASNVVPISVPSAQSQNLSTNNHVGGYDYLIATPISTSPGTLNTPTSVNMVFNHAFTILEFKVTRSDASTAKIKSIMLKVPSAAPDIAFTGTIDITQSTPASGVSYTISKSTSSKQVILSIVGDVTPSSDTLRFYMTILPGNHSSYVDTIGIEYSSNIGYYEKYAKQGKDFKRGVKYGVKLAERSEPYRDFAKYGVTLGGVTWAPVNAGYNNTTQIYGQYFQWGRKYGLTGIVGAAPNMTLVLDANRPTLATGNLDANRYNFYESTASNKGQWATDLPQTDPNYVWSSTNNPCPSGWRVPTKAEMQALVAGGYSAWTVFETKNGRYFPATPPNIFLSAGGSLDYNTGLFNGSSSNNGTFADYWTSNVSSKAYYDGACLEFTSGQAPEVDRNGAIDDFGQAHTVRCVKATGTP